ncbi:MAG: hypothetical protein EOM37_08180 [Proteobacteria bacterium]|nr:hypothetical protein [Pseudomonadota bacterium]
MVTSINIAHDLSPVRLSYVAALRGVLPLKPLDDFSYAVIGSFDVDDLLCLAASNPQGAFYAVVEDSVRRQGFEAFARERFSSNVRFVAQESDLPKDLTYLCACTTQNKPSDQEVAFDVAAEHLAPSGVFCFGYQAYANSDEALRFLIEEYAPELSDAQAKEFLGELKDLGPLYFEEHPIAKTALEKAIAAQDPSLFFSACLPADGTSTVSGTFEVMKGLLPRSFAFAGSADFASNYLQLSAPPSAYAALEKCNDQLLYEPIKDFVLGRCVRYDLWVKMPVEQSEDPAALFGYFTFGITMPREKVPTSFKTREADISFVSPLFMRLIDLMCTLPMGIGDFLQHPAGQGMNPQDVVAAIQVLVACGIAQPMRSRYEGRIEADIQRPSWASSYNKFLNKEGVASSTVRLASPIIGGAITISAKEALVLQAINQVGIPNSAGILQPMLQNLVRTNPGLAAQILQTTEPTDEVVHNLLTSTLSTELPHWYAYGLLAA